MVSNYLKIALRALWRNRAHSAINILGLGLGVMCCLLIVLFVRDEWTFDRFHSKADRIFRVYVKEDWGENQQFFNTLTPFPMGPVLKENFPEVEHQVRIVNTTSQVRVANSTFTETLTIADRSLFDVFDFAMLRGDRATALTDQRNIVLSDQAAQKYFGSQDPINQTLSVQLGEAFEEFVVAGVVHVPTNSSISLFLLIPDHNLPRLFSERALTSAWFNITPETYVLLREGVDPAALTAKFPSLFRTVLGEEDFKQSKYAPGLQPLTSIHLDPSYPAGMAPVSNPRYSYIMAAIALLILVVACINFVTLSVGRWL
jgi:putative ABC transport system permease protein